MITNLWVWFSGAVKRGWRVEITLMDKGLVRLSADKGREHLLFTGPELAMCVAKFKNLVESQHEQA